MSKRSEPDEDTVKVHVTPLGGLYVNERELLRSKAAQDMMEKMGRVLQSEGRGHQDPGSSAPERQGPSRER